MLHAFIIKLNQDIATILYNKLYVPSKQYVNISKTMLEIILLKYPVRLYALAIGRL
jgi:hypothetical protein